MSDSAVEFQQQLLCVANSEKVFQHAVATATRLAKTVKFHAQDDSFVENARVNLKEFGFTGSEEEALNPTRKTFEKIAQGAITASSRPGASCRVSGTDPTDLHAYCGSSDSKYSNDIVWIRLEKDFAGLVRFPAESRAFFQGKRLSRKQRKKLGVYSYRDLQILPVRLVRIPELSVETQIMVKVGKSADLVMTDKALKNFEARYIDQQCGKRARKIVRSAIRAQDHGFKAALPDGKNSDVLQDVNDHSLIYSSNPI